MQYAVFELCGEAYVYRALVVTDTPNQAMALANDDISIDRDAVVINLHFGGRYGYSAKDRVAKGWNKDTKPWL